MLKENVIYLCYDTRVCASVEQQTNQLIVPLHRSHHEGRTTNLVAQEVVQMW